MAKLDLAAAVWQFLYDHAVPAGPAVVQGVGLSTRIGAAARGQDQAGEMFVPGAARAVGSAVAANPVALLIPCHRVVRQDGRPGEYRWGAARKQALLAAEARA